MNEGLPFVRNVLNFAKSFDLNPISAIALLHWSAVIPSFDSALILSIVKLFLEIPSITIRDIAFSGKYLFC